MGSESRNYKSGVAPVWWIPDPLGIGGIHDVTIRDPQEIVPAIQRGLVAIDAGRPTVLEFITCDEGEFSKFAFV